MNNHLPECYQSEGKWGGGCICIRLRACEERVLDAAREAVNSMVIETAGNSAATLNQAVAAIDALREKPWPPLPPSKGVPTTPMWPLRKEKP